MNRENWCIAPLAVWPFDGAQFSAFWHGNSLQDDGTEAKLVLGCLSLRVYYSLAVWRFQPILSAGLRFHSHLSGGLRLRDYCTVAGNHKFNTRFSVFACFCGSYSNRVQKTER